MIPLVSDRSICIGCYMCWQSGWARNEWSMRRPRCSSCMLPNEIVGIISWLVMSCGFLGYITMSHMYSVERWRNHKAETSYPEQNSCSWSYRIRTASMLSTSSQIIPKWTTFILWQRSKVFLNKRSFLEEGRRIRNDLCFMSTIIRFTQVGVDILVRRTRHASHATLTIFTQFDFSDFYLFLAVKEKIERIQVRQEDQLFECLQDILGSIDYNELNRLFGPGYNGFKK
jgi:hypothetical protein